MPRPILQEIRDNMTCGTCDQMLWRCRCPSDAVCTECDQSVEDLPGQICDDALDGVHLWKVPDGDGFKIVREDEDQPDTVYYRAWNGGLRSV